MGIYVFLGFSATGFAAGFSSIYGLARRRKLVPVVTTLLTIVINVVGFFVPTEGYAMLPFYLSIVVAVGLTAVLLMPRNRARASPSV